MLGFNLGFKLNPNSSTACNKTSRVGTARVKASSVIELSGLSELVASELSFSLFGLRVFLFND